MLILISILLERRSPSVMFGFFTFLRHRSMLTSLPWAFLPPYFRNFGLA
jgi:hypothetical protein